MVRTARRISVIVLVLLLAATLLMAIQVSSAPEAEASKEVPGNNGCHLSYRYWYSHGVRHKAVPDGYFNGYGRFKVYHRFNGYWSYQGVDLEPCWI